MGSGLLILTALMISLIVMGLKEYKGGFRHHTLFLASASLSQTQPCLAHLYLESMVGTGQLLQLREKIFTFHGAAQ